jgi:hypothetical protein
MTDSAALKIDRAEKHVAELTKLFSETPPFSFVVRTNTATGDRSVGSRENKAIVDGAAGICGDAIHNLRSALDHAYWEIVSPTASKEEEKQVQFPFRETKPRFDKAVTEGFPNRVSPKFRDAMLGLRAYKEAGGNKTLYLIHEFDILDKHKLLIPTSDYTKFSSDMLRKQVPDFPANLTTNIATSGGLAGVGWRNKGVPRDQLGKPVPPTLNQFERELELPVHIVFRVDLDLYLVIPTLSELIKVTRDTLKIIRDAAS